ncbi:ribonuclease P protein component [Acuticoccus sp.]|uniref:ribonuclease P protein component n=1 Tax=Acuticoccus sp. TaxID=1904378 RepID=UPI003B51B90F
MHREAFTLQALARDVEAAGPGERAGIGPRVGFTVTKKVGNAVVRNRIKRRLRAASAIVRDDFAAGTDYVILARPAALTAPFVELTDQLAAALRAAHGKLHRPAVRERA